MKSVEYSQLVKRKLLKLKKELIGEYGEEKTKENGYWVLANYDRFKGGRPANIEVHGGATLEEVTVPVIEITYSPG